MNAFGPTYIVAEVMLREDAAVGVVIGNCGVGVVEARQIIDKPLFHKLAVAYAGVFFTDPCQTVAEVVNKSVCENSGISDGKSFVVIQGGMFRLLSGERWSFVHSVVHQVDAPKQNVLVTSVQVNVGADNGCVKEVVCWRAETISQDIQLIEGATIVWIGEQL